MPKIVTSADASIAVFFWPACVENAEVVELGADRYPVRRTPKRRLREVDFAFEGNEIRGLEQNPDTRSRWAEMARSGKKVMCSSAEGDTWGLSWMGR